MHWKDLSLKYIDYLRGACRYPFLMVGRTPLKNLSREPLGFRVLVVAAHPDDETLGAGVLLHRLRHLGVDVRVVFTTNGRGLDWKTPVRQQHATAICRLREAQSALGTLGLSPDVIDGLGFPDRGLHRYLSCAWKDISDCLASVSPHFVVTHGLEGGHRDHDVTSLIVQLVAAAQEVPVLEWAEYNRDFSLTDPMVGFPRNGGASSPLTLTMTEEEWQLKATALKAYQSQPESRHIGRRQEVFRWAQSRDAVEMLDACGGEPRVLKTLQQFGKSKLRNPYPVRQIEPPGNLLPLP